MVLTTTGATVKKRKNVDVFDDIIVQLMQAKAHGSERGPLEMVVAKGGAQTSEIPKLIESRSKSWFVKIRK